MVIDSASQINLFQCPALLSNVRDVGAIDICGVSDSTVQANQVGIHPLFGECYICPHTPTNIVSLNLLKRKFVILYDSHSSDAFVCTSKDHCIAFKYHDSGFWVYKGACDRPASGSTRFIAAPIMVGKSGKVYSSVEVSRAKEFQRFHSCRAHLGDTAAKRNFDANVYTDCPLTSKDVDNARDIFGPCPYCQVGKTVTPGSVDATNIPTAELGTSIHVDLVTFFGFGPFCLASEDHINYLMIQMLSSKATLNLVPALVSFIDHLHGLNFTVSHISTDREHTFGACVLPLSRRSPTVKLTQVPAGRHEKKLERQVRTIKERMRAICATLPFVVPPQCIEDLVYTVIQSLNDSTNTLSGHLTPRQAIEGTKPSYKLTCTASFGTFIAVPRSHQLDRQPRATVCVYLRHESGDNHRVFNIHSGHTISTSSKFTVLTPSELLITTVNSLSNENHKKLFKSMLDSMPSVVSEPTPSDVTVEETLDSDTNVGDVPGMLPDDALLTDPHASEELHVYSPVAPGTSDWPSEDAYSEYDLSSRLPSEPDKGGPSSATPETEAPPTDVTSEEAYVHDDAGDATEIASADAQLHSTLQTDTDPPDDDDELVVSTAPSREYSLRYPRSSWKDRNYSMMLHINKDLECPLSNLSGTESRYFSRDVLLMCLQTLTVMDAVKTFGQPAIDAVNAEIQQLVATNAMEPVHYRDLTDEEKKRVLSSMLKVKEKLKPDGTFDKIKARFLAGGHTQDRELYPNRSSPTANLTSFFSLAALAAVESRPVATLDVGGAFLNATLKTKQFLRVSKYLSSLIVASNPSWKIYLHKDCLILRLNKALYGLVESPLLWYEHISATLVELGYTCCDCDRCVYHKTLPGGEKVALCLHVDDLFITATRKDLLVELIDQLTAKYGNVSSSVSDQLQYLGMNISYDRASRSVSINQSGYVDQLLQQYSVSRTSSLPYAASLLNENVSDDKQPTNVNEYLSLTMKLLYLAKRTRPDILFVMSYLATKGQNPELGDLKKLHRVLTYINGTKHLQLTLRPSESNLHMYVDASYAIHQDCKGHSGAIISIGAGGGPVYATSTKQKLVSKSSTESELNALHEALSQLEWLQNLLSELGYPSAPATVYEDNMSTIILARDGVKSAGRSKHIQVRYFYVKQLIEQQRINLVHLTTDQQIADILTKPVVGAQFLRLRKLLLNL